MKQCGCSKNLSCNCCEGVANITPQPTGNRPGLNALRYRIGTHLTFFETMQSRLSGFYFDDSDAKSNPANKTYPLKNLKTRLSNDPAIALLSAAAVMFDVLTFYQERITNEGFLRTATERYSVLELGRLVGYAPRPGVAASVYFAYTLDDNSDPVEIPAGALAQSVPMQNELPQSFETSEKLAARKEWNDLKPRMSKPQKITFDNALIVETLYFEGTDTKLKTNDPLLFVFEKEKQTLEIIRRVQTVTPQFADNRTLVTLQTSPADLRKHRNKVKVKQTNITNLFKSLLIPPSLQPANSLRLGNSIQNAFNPKSDIRAQLLVNFHPDLAQTLYPALSKATVSVADPELKAVYALRVTAPLFGYNAPMITYELSGDGIVPRVPPIEPKIGDEKKLTNQLFLDNAYDQITASDKNKPSYIVINRDDDESAASQVFQITNTKIRPRTDYGVSSKTTVITLNRDWRKQESTTFDIIRQTIVYAQSEQLILADEPISNKIGCDEIGGEIELGELYEGLQAGRWIIVSGERADIEGADGIKVSELAMLAGIKQDFNPGDKYHSTLLLAGQNADGKSGLQYKYKRDTVKIYGNVVKATHGETRNEVLGSGDAAQKMQTFVLKQPPLTFVSAPTPSGVESTLHVRVNDVEWHETESLAELKSQDRKFITKIDDEAKISVIFGNGEQGARLPTGIENIKAVYRNGIGKFGNVKAEQISLLLTKPLGVKEVINPLRASGGADKETRDQARRNVPIALSELDRLVSTSDYADFARTFAGIGKTSAARLSDGYRQIVHLTIAGAEDVPIDVNSDLYHNLRRALKKYGDAFQPVKVVKRDLLALVITAKISILADYLWESVAPKIRAALLETFSFERRELGQSVFLSEVVSVIQNVEGVAYSDVDVLDSISETELDSEDDLQKKVDHWGKESQSNPYVKAELARINPNYQPKANPPQEYILPAQLAYLTPDVPDTLILNKIEEVKK